METTTMLILFVIVISIIIGVIGSERKIGFGGAFFGSLLLTPIFGLAVTLSSKRLKDIEQQKKQDEKFNDILFQLKLLPKDKEKAGKIKLIKIKLEKVTKELLSETLNTEQLNALSTEKNELEKEIKEVLAE